MAVSIISNCLVVEGEKGVSRYTRVNFVSTIVRLLVKNPWTGLKYVHVADQEPVNMKRLEP